MATFLQQVDAAVGVAPLVVVPGQHLHEIAVHDLRVGAVDDRGMRVAAVVDRDQRRVLHVQDALHRARGGGAHRAVDVVDGDRLLDQGHQVDARDVRRRHAHRDAVELALEGGQHLADGRGGAGRRRDDRHRGGAGAAHVLVRQVEQVLVVGVGVHGGHPAALEAERVVQHLDHGGEAVGRARRVRDDVVRGRVVLLVVHAHDERDVGLLGGGGDDDLLRAGGQVLGGAVAVGELARALEDHVDAQVLPGQGAGILAGEHLELVAVDRDAVGAAGDRGAQVAEHRVVLQQVRQRLGVGEVVDTHEIDVAVGQGRAHDVAPDSTEPVDAYSDGHVTPPHVVSRATPIGAPANV